MTDIIKTDESKNIQQNVPQKFMNNFDMQGLLVNAGNVELNEEQKKILYAPIDETLICIKPTGIVYLPWTFYATRLRVAFGMQWTMIPTGMPQMMNNLVIWGFYLYIKGSLMGFAIGEQNYIASNKEMSYTDACEGAKSNALMRLCKEIGIGLELWQQEFVAKWKQKYAISYQEFDDYKKKNVTKWKKKTDIKMPENKDDIKNELKNSLKNDKPNENLIKKTFGSKTLTPKKDEVIKKAGELLLNLSTTQIQPFKKELKYYTEMKNKQEELSEDKYQEELKNIELLKTAIETDKKNKTGAVNESDPVDVDFHIEDKKEDDLPPGVI